MQIRDASAVVTGAGSGLGLATAEALVARGAKVVIVDLPQSNGADEAARIGAAFAAADITDSDQLSVALDQAADLGPLRALVHCAGRGGDRLPILNEQCSPSPLESFDEILRINLSGTYNVLRLAAQRMSGNDVREGDRGSIVMTASIAAFDGQIGQTAYTASKAAVHGITLVAARDLARWQIRVNTIAPGTFETPMFAQLSDSVRDSLAAAVPHPKRLGQPVEYASLAVQMLENGYLNGQTVRLDGSIRMPPE